MNLEAVVGCPISRLVQSYLWCRRGKGKAGNCLWVSVLYRWLVGTTVMSRASRQALRGGERRESLFTSSGIRRNGVW